MNYITEINLFQTYIVKCGLKPQEISLWLALMDICNRSMWKEEFYASKKTLAKKSGMSESSVSRARERLEALGMIVFRQEKGCPYGVYHMCSLEERGLPGQDGAVREELSDEMERGEETAVFWEGETKNGVCEKTLEGVTPCPEVSQRELGVGQRDLGVSQRDLGVSQRDLGVSQRDLGVSHTDLLYKTINNKQSSLSPCTREDDGVGVSKNETTTLDCFGQGFEQFWQAYPVHASEKNARQQYALLVGKGVPAQYLLGAARNYAASCGMGNVQEKYIKYASNWLREEVYVDYLPGNWKGNIVEYKKTPASGKSRAKGKASCSSREYDFDELERVLLARGM